MGAFLKLIDAILFVFFVGITIAVPLIDAQICLPINSFPSFLIDLKQRYTDEYGDYLLTEKPHFFVGIVWLQLLFQWPLALINIFAILTSKSWVNTTCLIYGSSVLTSMAAIMGELMRSGKGNDKLMMVYHPFVGLGVLAFLRGLLSPTSKTMSLNIISRRPVLGRKKRV